MNAIIIKNGKVFTGYDQPSKISNILIKDGIVVEMSEKEIHLKNAKVIDASGKWVMPGFIAVD